MLVDHCRNANAFLTRNKRLGKRERIIGRDWYPLMPTEPTLETVWQLSSIAHNAAIAFVWLIQPPGRKHNVPFVGRLRPFPPARQGIRLIPRGQLVRKQVLRAKA